MRRARTLPAFTQTQFETARALLAGRVATMMGRKLEEADWQIVYCVAKDIPVRGWSNLNIDVVHGNLGVEHKMLGQPDGADLKAVAGKRLMHPAATRSIRIPTSDDPEEVKRVVLGQYADLITQRQRYVSEGASGKAADLRTGWLIWEVGLREFLYFEEETIPPNPSDYFAEWRTSGGGRRKESRNLWVFEKETQIKRFSITTEAGAKIQPYFDVPTLDDPNLYYFRVQSEQTTAGMRLWVSAETAHELRRLVGDLGPETLADVIDRASALLEDAEVRPEVGVAPGVALEISNEAYETLLTMFAAGTDEGLVRKLMAIIREL